MEWRVAMPKRLFGHFPDTACAPSPMAFMPRPGLMRALPESMTRSSRIGAMSRRPWRMPTSSRTIARQQPFQLVFAGKAHPRDEEGKRLIEELHRYIESISPAIPMVFLPNYDMTLGAALTAGADIWLNTPLPPLEASGTSGMKAALNGVLNLSVLDGWWLEACLEGVTGWAIGSDGKPDSASAHSHALYRQLGETVLPLYYEDRERWIWMMKQSVSKIGAFFNRQRMMRRYAAQAYLR